MSSNIKFKTDYLRSEMSTLEGNVGGQNVANASMNFSCSSDTAVPSNEPNAVNNTLNAIKDLINKLKSEIGTIKASADTIDNLEADMQKYLLTMVGNEITNIGSIEISSKKADSVAIKATSGNGSIKISDDLIALYNQGMARPIDFTKYKKSMSGNYDGFGLYLSSRRYNVDDLCTELAEKWGFDTPEEAFEAFVAVMLADGGDKTPDDILASLSVALNRCEREAWVNQVSVKTGGVDSAYRVKIDGSNPFDQMFYNNGCQYSTIQSKSYQQFMPSVVGRDAVDAELARYKMRNPDVCTYEEACAVVLDALTGGVRNNDFTGMRAPGYGYSTARAFSANGGWYQYENYNQDLASAQEAQSKRYWVSVEGNPNYFGLKQIKVDPGTDIDSPILVTLPAKTTTTQPEATTLAATTGKTGGYTTTYQQTTQPTTVTQPTTTEATPTATTTEPTPTVVTPSPQVAPQSTSTVQVVDIATDSKVVEPENNSEYNTEPLIVGSDRITDDTSKEDSGISTSSQTYTQTTVKQPNKAGTIAKTIGGIAVAGAAVGAGVYGYNTYVKNRDDEIDEEDDDDRRTEEYDDDGEI